MEPNEPRRHPPDDHLPVRRVLAERPAVTRMLRRIASEIIERNHGTAGLALVGIRTGGWYLAQRLQALIGQIEGTPETTGGGAFGDDDPLPVGAVDIALYRDDVFEGLPKPVIGPTELPFELAGVRIVLVDDVLFTGRTVRAALDALMDYGRPKAVQLAVLVDRGLRELPIRADYVGLTIDTEPDDSIKVELDETGGDDRIVLRSRSQP